MEKSALKKTSYAGLVWIASGAFLLIYSGLGLLSVAIPGVEELVTFIQHTSGMYIYLAAFMAIFFEGLYIVGNFIPGSTFVLLLAVFAQAGGTFTFLGTILAIFVGWCFAGAINIFVTAKIIQRQGARLPQPATVHDRLLTTWYPAFRANYEVAQVVAGVPAWKVLVSSLRVKIWASLGAMVYALILPYVMDINTVNNDEGFWTVAAIALVCIIIGIVQLYQPATATTDPHQN
jgi:hypothetical protein